MRTSQLLTIQRAAGEFSGREFLLHSHSPRVFPGKNWFSLRLWIRLHPSPREFRLLFMDELVFKNQGVCVRSPYFLRISQHGKPVSAPLRWVIHFHLPRFQNYNSKRREREREREKGKNGFLILDLTSWFRMVGWMVRRTYLKFGSSCGASCVYEM